MTITDDLRALIDSPECCWDYIDRLRMALAAVCKERDELKSALRQQDVPDTDVGKSMTNADRIRAMSDEELVVFLDEFGGRCLHCEKDAKNESCPIYKEGYYCRPQDIMEWLQQPAEDDHHE